MITFVFDFNLLCEVDDEDIIDIIYMMQEVRNISSQSVSFLGVGFPIYDACSSVDYDIMYCISRLIAVGRVCSCFFWRDVRQEAFLIRLYDDDNHFRLSAFFILFFIFYFSQPM